MTYYYDSDSNGSYDTTATLDQNGVRAANFMLTGDITFDSNEAAVDWDGSGTVGDGTDANGFAGIYTVSQLDGNDYSINNLYIDNSASYIGFINRGTGGTEISDLNFGGDIDVTVGSKSGVLIGLYQDGVLKIDDVSIVDNNDTTALLTGSGENAVLVGSMTGTGSVTIDGCLVDGDVKSSSTNAQQFGGFIGSTTGTATIAINDSEYSGKISGGLKLGGFIGYQKNGSTITISDSLVDNSTITATHTTASSRYGVGGFVGYIEQNTTTPTLTIYNSQIDNTDLVNGQSMGGFVGEVLTGGNVTVLASTVGSNVTMQATGMSTYSGGVLGNFTSASGTSTGGGSLTVTDSQVLGGFDFDNQSGNRIGGMVGRIYASNSTLSFNNSYFAGTMTGTIHASANVGGIIGSKNTSGDTYANIAFNTDSGVSYELGYTTAAKTGVTRLNTTNMQNTGTGADIDEAMSLNVVNTLTGVKWVHTDGAYPTLQYAAPGNITLTNSDTQVGSTYIEKTGDSITLGGDSPITDNGAGNDFNYKIKVTFSDGTNADKIKYITGTGTTGWTDNFDLSSSDLNLIKDTTYTVTVSAVTDKGAAADSAVTASETFSLIYTDDTTAPTYSGAALAATGAGKAVSTSGGTIYTNDDTPTFSFTLADTHGVDSGSVAVTGATGTLTNDGNGNFTFTVTGALTVGTKTLTINASDSYGNAMVAETFDFTLETTAPTNPAVTDATIHFGGGTTDRAQTVTAGDSITVEGAYDDTLGGSPETLVVVDGSGIELATYTLTDNSTNNWSVSIDTSSLSGSVELFVKVRDAAGNVSNVSTSKIDLTVEVPVEPESDPVVVDPVVETPTSSDPVTTPVAQDTPVEAGLEDSLIVQETSVDTDVELYTGQPESIEQTMEQVAQQISQTLSVAYSSFDVNVTVEAPTFADTFNTAETTTDANTAAKSNTPAPQPQPMTMEVFKQLDADTSGLLKVEELNQRYEGIDFDKADLNEDGLIDEKEFKKLILEMEKGKNKEKQLSKLLDSTHVLESAPTYASAFQTPLGKALDKLLAFNI